MARDLSIYRDLPQQSALPHPDAHDVVEARVRRGEVPVIGPKDVFRTPMWVHQVTASQIGPSFKTQVYERSYSNFAEGQSDRTIVRVRNDITPAPAGEVSAHGALRYLDLDIMMALALNCTRQGMASPEVEIMQRQIFDWMGYSHLVHEPYDELRASLERLQGSDVFIYKKGTPLHDQRKFRLLDSAKLIDVGGRGSPKLIKARLSDVWADSLKTGTWQTVDLVPYAKLVREHRKLGLSRVLYLFFASWRDASMRFQIPLWSVRERYAQARPDGRLKYSNPFAPGSQLVRALKTLHESGVIRLDQLPGVIQNTHILRGEFLPVSAPNGGARQLWLVAPGWLGNQPQMIEDRQNPKPAESTADVATAPAAPKPGASAPKPETQRDPIHDSIILLNREIRVGKKQFQAAIVKSGWSKPEILHLMAEVYWRYKTKGSIDEPAGLFIAKLRDHPPIHYAEPPEAAWSWLATAWPSLPVFTQSTSPKETSP